MDDLRGKTVLVTGGTGFIGGRLVEKIVLDHGARVRVPVRQLYKAVRIARLPVELVKADLSDPESTRAVMQGCDVVFHCAWSYDPKDREKNLKAVENIMQAAAAAGIRVVYTSTIAFYQSEGVERLTEQTPYHHSGNPYADAKHDAEMLVRSYIEKGTEAVVLQPSIVYGPWSAIFSWHPIWQLKRGIVTLLDKGEGVCNAVYIDDVVDAHCLAAAHPKAPGGTFLVSGAEPVTWKAFYSAYEKMLGVDALTYRTHDEISEHLRKERRYHSRYGRLRSGLGHLIRDNEFMKKIKPSLKAILRQNTSGGPATETSTPAKAKKWVYMPSEEFFKLFQNTTQIRPDKIREQLGFAPGFDLERGMKYTHLWADWANLL